MLGRDGSLASKSELLEYTHWKELRSNFSFIGNEIAGRNSRRFQVPTQYKATSDLIKEFKKIQERFVNYGSPF